MNLAKRIEALEARDRAPARRQGRLTMAEMDLVLSSFPPLDRVLSEAERREAERLIASCATDLTDAELDVQLALIVDSQ